MPAPLSANVPSPSEFTIRTFREQDTLVLRVEGELDLRSAPSLSRAVASAISERPTRIAIDCSAISFMDSSGLATLVRAHRAAASADQDLYLKHPAPQPRRLLELTGMLDAFLIED